MTATLQPASAHGGDTNYTEFEDDGTMEFKGTATVWDDLVGSLIASRLESTAGKLNYNYANNTITMQSGGSISTANDRLIFNYQKPHGAKTASSMNLHIHWEQVSTDQIEWAIQYRIQSNNAAKTTDWTSLTANSVDDSVFTYPGSGAFNQITHLASIDLTDSGISATVQFRLARTDSTSDDIDAVFVDAHVEYDMLGSRTEFTK